MKILLDGYLDRNLGDDLMLYLASLSLQNHELFTVSDAMCGENVRYTNSRKGYDVYLKVTGSGFLIHSPVGIAYRLRDMYREKHAAPTHCILGCNISDFINAGAEKAICRQLKGYDFVTVRDKFSYSYIKSHIPNLNCEFYPDIVFSLPDEMIPNVHCEGHLGISVHGSASVQSLANIADGYIKKTGKKVVLLCFDSGRENDVGTANGIKQLCKYNTSIEIEEYTSIPDMLAAVKKCGVLLGIRLHSNILASRMEIPFVPIEYSKKTSRALSGGGCNVPVFSADNLNEKEILNAVLSAKKIPFDKSVSEKAKMHFIKFNEFIENIK